MGSSRETATFPNRPQNRIAEEKIMNHEVARDRAARDRVARDWPAPEPGSPDGGSPSDPKARQRGIALFIVVIIVTVLSVVVYQLTNSTKIEESIALNRKGFMKLSYSLQSVAREVIVRLHEDWTQDIEGDQSGGEEEGGGGAGAGGTSGMPGLSGGAAGGGEEAQSTAPIDSRHETTWAHTTQQQINDVEVEIRILDGEGRLDLNQLFWYVVVAEEDQSDLATVDGSDPTEIGGTTPDPTDPEGSTEEEDEEDEETEGYELPSDERVELTREMLVRLVEAVIDYNQDFEFYYEDSPSAETAAEEIVNYVLNRVNDDELGPIFRVEVLKPLVGSELYYGPRDPAEDEEGDEDDDGDDEPRSSGFGAQDVLEGLGYTGELGLDEASGYEETDEGVTEIPRPLGLRELFTAFADVQDVKQPSKRRWPALNLNTCRPEILMALMIVSFDDFDEAREVALQINDHLNTFEGIDDDEDESTVNNNAAESDDDETSEDDEELEEPQMNVFRQFDDIGQVNEEEWVSDTDQQISDQQSIFTRLKNDLENVAVFKSTHFTAILDGKSGHHPIRGELVVKRQEKGDKKWIQVLYWREDFQRDR